MDNFATTDELSAIRQHQVVVSPHGVIIDSDHSISDWQGQPFMRFVHSDDLILFCAGLSAASKQQQKQQQQQSIRFHARIFDPPRRLFAWRELTVTAPQPQPQEQEQQLQVVYRQPSKQIMMQCHAAAARPPAPLPCCWQDRLHHIIENGLMVVAQALVSLVQLMHDHGYQFRPEMADRLLGVLEWSGLVKDIASARAALDRLLDHCVSWYTDQCSVTAPKLCDMTL